jgi:hypothetical protein
MATKKAQANGTNDALETAIAAVTASLRTEREQLLPAMMVDIAALRDAERAARSTLIDHTNHPPAYAQSAFDEQTLVLDARVVHAEDMRTKAEQASATASRRIATIDALIGAPDAERDAREDLERIDGEITETQAGLQRVTAAIAMVTVDIDAVANRVEQAEAQAAGEAADRYMAGERVRTRAAPASDDEAEIEDLDSMLRALRAREAKAKAALVDLRTRAAEVRASWRRARALSAELTFEGARLAIAPFAVDLLAARELAGQCIATTTLKLVVNPSEVAARARAIESEVPLPRVVAIEAPADEAQTIGSSVPAEAQSAA